MGPDNGEPESESLANFLSAVDKAYFEYEDKIKVATRSLEISSQELNVSNRQLETLNETINTMLDSLGQGLVFFNAEGVCSSVYSKSCVALLDAAPGSQKIFEILKLTPAQLESFHSWLNIIFLSSSSALSFDDLAELAPDHYINHKKQFIQLEYRPVMNLSNELAAVLLIATDKSLEKKAEEALKETEALSQVIVSISQNRNEFCSLMRNVRALIADLSGRDNDNLTEILREFHTYKGLSYHFGLQKLGDAFHRAENHIQDGDITPAHYSELINNISRELAEANRQAEELLGPDYLDRGQVRTIEISQIRFLREKLMEMNGAYADVLKNFINEEMLGAPLHECFSVFDAELGRLASLQGKPIPAIHYNSSINSLIMSDYSVFFESLIHLARNIMDHGIEAPMVRRRAGKPEEGRVDISVQYKNSMVGMKVLEICIKDDGNGFQIDRMRQRLDSLGLYQGDVAGLSEQDVIQYVFHPNFSTQSSVSTLSGRGVGMYAIQKAVEGLRGTSLARMAQPGAEFIFELPVST